MNETRTLAQFAAEIKYEDLPGSVVAKTKQLILDQLGAQIGISTKPFLRPVYEYMKALGGTKESTVVNYGDKTTAENAAFVNGTFGHGFEFDDVHSKSISHPGSVIVSAALALGEREHSTGKDFILAVALGHDVMCRIGSAMAKSSLDRGFHSMTRGPFGAAAAAGSILGFDKDKMLNALGIAGNFAPGLTEYQQSGGEEKRIHAGMAAQGGIRAALLAGLGLTGPPTILEGQNGFCRAFADDYQLEKITSGLGKEFVVLEVWSKRYCCNGMLHAPIDAIHKIRSKHAFKLEDVEEVIMGSNHRATRAVGAMREPKDMTSFQFSAYYTLAMTLVKGSNDFKDVTEENLKDPQIAAVAAKVKVEMDKEVDAMYPEKMGARVTIKLKDGTVYQELVRDCKGSPGNPMTDQEMKDKFRGLAIMVLPKNKVERIISIVDRLEELRDISKLCALLVR